MLIGHAKIEETAQMLWMIITAAVSLDTRGRIVVLVRRTTLLLNEYSKIFTGNIRFLLRVNEQVHKFSTACGNFENPQPLPVYLIKKKKISTIVLIDHAKMEEAVQMLWMIITAAVSLDTRGRIVVLVSRATLLLNEYSKIFKGNIRFLLRVNEHIYKFSTACKNFENP